MFGSFPNQLNVQVLHQSEVKAATVKHKNDAINLTLDCLETKLGSKRLSFDRILSLFVHSFDLLKKFWAAKQYTFSIPKRLSDTHFEKRIGDLAKFLNKSIDNFITSTKKDRARKSLRCARSEVDLHIHFDEEKSQNPTQEQFFSPQEYMSPPTPVTMKVRKKCWRILTAL